MFQKVEKRALTGQISIQFSWQKKLKISAGILSPQKKVDLRRDFPERIKNYDFCHVHVRRALQNPT